MFSNIKRRIKKVRKKRINEKPYIGKLKVEVGEKNDEGRDYERDEEKRRRNVSWVKMITGNISQNQKKDKKERKKMMNEKTCIERRSGSSRNKE